MDWRFIMKKGYTIRLPGHLRCLCDIWASRAGLSTAEYIRHVVMHHARDYAQTLMVYDKKDEKLYMDDKCHNGKG
jgi:hypothetical protein